MGRHDGAPTPAGRDVHAAAAELASLRRLAAQQALLAVAAAVGAGLAASLDPRLAAAFGAGFVAEAILAFLSVCCRRHTLLVLAAERDTYALDEVRRFGASLTTPRRRLALARTIAAVLRESSESDSIYVLDRVAAEAPALAAIAHALADKATVIEPTAMAALLQLLTDGHGSPLLNPAVTSDELGRTLARVLTGIHPRPARSADIDVSATKRRKPAT